MKCRLLLVPSLLLVLLVLAVGCQVALPPGGCGPPCRGPHCPPPACVPYLPCVPIHPAYFEPEAHEPPVKTRQQKGSAVALRAPTDQMLSRGLYGLARLIAETPAFQTESGLESPTIDSVMEACCYWPEQPPAERLTVPLCLITLDEDHHIIKSRNRLAQGVALVQVCLAESPGLSDPRDRFTDAADRFGLIMSQAMNLAEQRDISRLWVTGWELDRPPILNDPDDYPFATPAGQSVRVRIFPVAMRFQG